MENEKDNREEAPVNCGVEEIMQKTREMLSILEVLRGDYINCKSPISKKLIASYMQKYAKPLAGALSGDKS